MTHHAEIERCDREIAEMERQPPGAPAYLTTLGMLDWRRERRLIELEQLNPCQRLFAESVERDARRWRRIRERRNDG